MLRCSCFSLVAVLELRWRKDKIEITGRQKQLSVTFDARPTAKSARADRQTIFEKRRARGADVRACRW